MSGSARLIRKPATTSGASGRGQPGGQPAEVLDPELAVAVGERDELVAGGPEAGAQGGAVAQVGRVVDGADDARMGGGQLVGDLAGAVARAVVDGDDLERLGQGRQDVARASSTRPARFASSLWAGKKYDSRATRRRRGGAAVLDVAASAVTTARAGRRRASATRRSGRGPARGR